MFPTMSFFVATTSSVGVVVIWFSLVPNSAGFIPERVILILSLAMSASPLFSIFSRISNGSVPLSNTSFLSSEKSKFIPVVPPINGCVMSTVVPCCWHPARNIASIIINGIIFFIYLTFFLLY